MKIESAKELLEAIKTFRIASDGDSGDNEHDASHAVADIALGLLKEESGRDIALADLIDEFEAEQAEDELVDEDFIDEVNDVLGVERSESWEQKHTEADVCKAVLRVADSRDPARRDTLALAEKLRQYPADWQVNSSLETWFPLTAEEMKRDKTTIAALSKKVNLLNAELRSL